MHIRMHAAETLNPNPETLNPEPQTLNPKPWTRVHAADAQHDASGHSRAPFAPVITGVPRL
jgi:hypothetical protein